MSSCKQFHVDRQVDYFVDYVKRYTDMPMLVSLVEQDGRLVPDRFLRASDLDGALDEANNAEWKTLAFDAQQRRTRRAERLDRLPLGREGQVESRREKLRRLAASTCCCRWRAARTNWSMSPFPISAISSTSISPSSDHASILPRAHSGGSPERSRTARRWSLRSIDLFLANYGVDRGFGGENVARDFDDDVPYSPAWAEAITGVAARKNHQVAHEFALNAEKTKGRSMVIIGAAMNHWFHCDMNYRGVINMLVMCGCVGQSGGGWAHYVGQEKLRPQTGWAPLAFALDWSRPPRQMNGTSFFYAHTDQWRYETLDPKEILSPTAPAGPWDGAVIDYNVRAERMGWLPSAPQLEQNPLTIWSKAAEKGLDPRDYVAQGLMSGELKLSCDDPDDPQNWPRNMFVWRSNLLGSSGKGHEYFLKHLLGTSHGVLGKNLGEEGRAKPQEVGVARGRRRKESSICW